MFYPDKLFYEETGYSADNIKWNENSGRYADWAIKKIESLQSLLKQSEGKREKLEKWVKKMIRGGETTEMLSKGNDFYEAKGALEAFRAMDELLTTDKGAT